MIRPGSRYLLVRIISIEPISVQTFDRTVDRMVEESFGKFGSAEMKVRMIGLNAESDRAVVRCAQGSVEKLRTALAMISRVDGQPAAAMVLRSSGTIRGLGVRVQRRQE